MVKKNTIPLNISHPDIANQWHPGKNAHLRPDDVTYGSSKRLWWKCPEGLDHEWQDTVANRTHGRGCPFCSGRRASFTNCLAVLYPSVASEWHPSKNGGTTPDQVVPGTHRKAWWKCPKGPDHEWEYPVYYRTASKWQSGCPFCSGRKPSLEYSLKVLYPQIASEWHPSKNGSLEPEQVVPQSIQGIWALSRSA